jgi:hypothetical protein
MSIGTSRISSQASLIARGLLSAAAMFAVVAGCSRDNVAHAASSSDPVANVQDDNGAFEVKTETKGECKVGAECVVVIHVNAKGEYHVNKDYPFKFTAAAQGVEFHGSGGNVFTAGDFAREEKHGAMTIKFKPSAKGKVTISGPYKICICTDKICQPTTTNVSFDVDVK